MPGWRPLSIERKRSVLIRKVRAAIDALMKEVNSRTLTVRRIASLIGGMNCCLGSPCLSITASWICVIQVLSSIRFLLPARRTLPLFELLEWQSINIMYWYNWISVYCFTHKVLEFVLDFGLLLFQILGLECRLFVRQLSLFNLLVLCHSGASSPWLILLLLVHLLNQTYVV